MRLRSFRKMSSGLFIAAMLLNVFNCNPIFVHALAEENVHTNTNETAAPEAEEGGESDSEQTEIGDGTEGDSTDEEQTEIDDVESENTEETVAPEQTEEIGDLLDQAIVAQLPPQPIEIESAGVDALPTESGVYLYNLVQDSAQIFNLTFPDTIFKNNSDKGDITVTITLPKYGMAFTDNMVHDLSSAPQIKSAGFIKNSSGYNTGLTFVIDSHINKQYLTAFSTQYVPLSQKQCADIIANGWEESPVEIVVKNGAGEVVSTNTKYTMKPGKYIEPDINIPAHNNTTTSIAAHTLLDTVKTDSGGLFHFSSPIGLENQKIVLAVDENTKPTKQETGAEIWDSIDDSDFDRETKSLILPKLNKEKNENCSGGLIHLPTLTVENIVMHVKDTHALHTVSKSENPANLNPAVTYTVTSGNADLSILTSTDVTGEKIGVQKIKASISNTLGDVVAKEFEVKIYANIIYHANGNTGDVPIDNTQYTSGSDTVVVKDNLSLSKPGYVFYGWSKNKDAVVPEYFPHTVFTFGETEKDVVLYAIFRPIVIKPEKPPVSLRPAPLVPDTSDQTHIWKYVFWLILSIGTAFTANRYRTKRHSE